MSGKSQKIVFVVLIAILAVGGYFLHAMQMNSLRQKLMDRCKKAETALNKLREANEEARANEAAARAKEKTAQNERKKAEAERDKSESERKAAEERADAEKQEKENVEAKRKLAGEETVRAQKAAEAAAAEQKRLEAEKAASEAKAKELAEQRAKDEVTLKIAAEARAQSEADAARKLAEQKKAEAENAKSENERKAAELHAAARRDERLLMYKRGGASESERKEGQRAEKMMKLWDAGLLTPENLAAANALPSLEELSAQETNQEEDPEIAKEKEKLKERETPPPPPDPRDEKIKALRAASGKRLNDETRRVSEEIVARIEPLLRLAERTGRTRDAAYYRSVLKSLVPGYGEGSPEK